MQTPSFFMPGGKSSSAFYNADTSTGVLAGLRLAVKDVFHMQGLPTTAGNPQWAKTHPIPTHTHGCVIKLLQSGARFVGKTVTDELAYSLNGQNIHYGTPTNYAAPERLPGGSSSGSAAAVAGDFADIGLGTDTGGSIRVPASYNGLYGLRPSHGNVSSENMVHLAPSFDTVGWMTRDPDVMHKVTSLLLPPGPNAKAGAEQAPVFGVLDNTLPLAAHKAQIESWLSRTAITTQWVNHIDPQAMELAESFRILQGAEIIALHGDWLKHNSSTFAPDIQARIAQSRRISDADVSRAKDMQCAFVELIIPLFEQYSALIIPTTPGPAPLLSATAESLAEYRTQLLTLTALAGLAGLPQLHLPVFTQDDAPCGISLIGPKGSELQLIHWANLINGQ